MRCPKCNRSLGLGAQYCPNCGTAAPAVPSGRKKKKLIVFLIWLGTIVLLIPVMYYFASHAQHAQNYTSSENFWGALIVAFLGACGLYLIYHLVKFAARRPLLSIPSAVLIAVLVFAGIHFYRQQQYNNLPNNLFLVQETLTEVAVEKEIGDALTAGQKNVPGYFNWGNVEQVADNMARRLAKLGGSNLLNDYKKSGIAWAQQIRDAAKDPKNWKDVPNEPDSFNIKLKENEAVDLFIQSLIRIDELAQFGDYAMGRGDKETMHYIIARLSVQKQWLDGLANFQEVKFFANLVNTAYAALSDLCAFSSKYSLVCGNKASWQLQDIDEKIDKLLRAATQYTLGDESAQKRWIEASNQIVDMIEKQGLSRETPGEISDIMRKEGLLPSENNGAKQQPAGNGTSQPAANAAPSKKIPPEVQTFRDDCFARNGTLGGLLTDDQLPTREAGYWCRYVEDNKKCWKLLTYSGSDFAGGEPDCEEQHLLPPGVPGNSTPPATPAQPKSPASPAPPKTPPAPKPQLPDLGPPTGTAAPKMEFTVSQTTFAAQVGEHFQHSFCEPALTNSSDLCTAAATNPRYGLPPYSFSLESGVGFPPLGLTLNLNGLLEGTPTAAGSRTFGICATDTGGFSVCREVTVNVAQKKTQASCYYDSLGESPSYPGQPTCCQHHVWCNGPNYCCEENGCQCN